MATSLPIEIVKLTLAEAEARQSELAALLVDAVEGGASVGFMTPFSLDESLAYWRKVLTAVAEGRAVLLAALCDNRAVGTVQLGLAPMPNQSHRADVAKLLVHRDMRRRGIGRALMERIENVALENGRTVLVLDTLTGSEAIPLYQSLGYLKAGIIPNYANWPDGSPGDTMIFYKQL
jgi:ribosomal protein S18 acetylase RimI-like enzyme